MASRLVFAIATHREARLPGKSRQQIERSAVFGSRHLGPIALHESTPLALGLGTEAQLDRLRRRRKVRKPNVVPVARGKLGLRDAARRPPHRTDAQPLVRDSVSAQTNDPNGHESLQPSRPSFEGRPGAPAFRRRDPDLGEAVEERHQGRWSTLEDRDDIAENRRIVIHDGDCTRSLEPGTFSESTPGQAVERFGLTAGRCWQLLSVPLFGALASTSSGGRILCRSLGAQQAVDGEEQSQHDRGAA